MTNYITEETATYKKKKKSL